MSHFASINALKSKLEVDDLVGDKPVPENIKKSFEDFKKICLESGFSSDIIDKAWERSVKGKKLYNVSDMCWALMNSTGSDLSERTSRKNNESGGGGGDQDAAEDADNNKMNETKPKAPLVTRKDIESTSLIAYYKSLFLEHGKVFKDEAEWNLFLDSLCSPLPMSLRLHQQGPYKKQCAEILLSQDLGKLVSPHPCTTGEKSSIPVYSCSNQAYRDSRSNQEIAKTGHSGGLWSFQEFVSMLPVAALEIQPDHLVFDLCAAPGSKSLQALDAMNGQQQASLLKHQNIFNILKNGGGCLFCNEKQSVKAQQVLAARMKRYSALQNIVVCSDATKLPWICYNDITKKLENAKTPEEKSSIDPRAYFDRVLNDSPCSGDGTIRKDRTIFGTWNIEYVNQLAEIQLKITRRAVGMAKVGGLVAYSTCSMNPIEDEHIIFQIMCLMNKQGTEAQLELVDVNEVLKNNCGLNLHSSGGIDLAKIEFDPNNSDDSADQQQQQQPPWSFQKLMDKVPGSFKPSLEDAKKLSSEIAKKVLRVLPHRDNTGGFFVALLRKRHNYTTTLPNPKKFQLFSNRKRFELVHPHDEEWKKAMEWFFEENSHNNNSNNPVWKTVFPKNDGTDILPVPHVLLYPKQEDDINNNNSSSSLPFPTHEPVIPFWCVSITSKEAEKLNASEKDRKKRIHITTLSSARIVFNAQLAGGNLELVNFGVRLFERLPGKYLDLTVHQRLRMTSEAVDLIQPTKRVWKVLFEKDAEFIKNLLLKGSYQFMDLTSKSAVPSSLQQDHTDDGSSNVVKPGSFVFCFKFSENCEKWLAAILTPLGKVDLMVDASERRMLLQVYFGLALESSKTGIVDLPTSSGKRRQRVEGEGDDEDEDGNGEDDLGVNEEDDEV